VSFWQSSDEQGRYESVACGTDEAWHRVRIGGSSRDGERANAHPSLTITARGRSK
jgi:hypothetical protein